MKHQAVAKLTVAIEGRALSQALKPILRVIERRNTYPILGAVKLAVSGARLTFIGTDLDIEVTVGLDVNEATGDWAVCVYPATLAKIAKLAGQALVHIQRTSKFSDGLKPLLVDEMIVTVDGARYVLPCLSADSFPSLNGTRGNLIERFTNGALAQMLGKVAPYISREETRYYLNGVCWQDGERGRRFAATDGHRLGICQYMTDKAQPVSRIIPRKTVALLMSITAGQDVAIYEVAGKPAIDIIVGSTTIRSKLIEGTFPDIDRVIPKSEDAAHKIYLRKIEAIAAMDQVSVISASHWSRAVKFDGCDGVMELSVTSPEKGEAVAATRIAWPDDCPSFGMNLEYIRGMIASCQGDITMHVKDAGAPFRITDEDEMMTRVIMPMRV